MIASSNILFFASYFYLNLASLAYKNKRFEIVPEFLLYMSLLLLEHKHAIQQVRVGHKIIISRL